MKLVNAQVKDKVYNEIREQINEPIWIAVWHHQFFIMWATVENQVVNKITIAYNKWELI